MSGGIDSASELVDLMFWREAGKWIGEGVFYDIGTQADTFDAAVEQLEITAGIELWEFRANARGPLKARQWRRAPDGYHVIRLTIAAVPIAPIGMEILP